MYDYTIIPTDSDKIQLSIPNYQGFTILINTITDNQKHFTQPIINQICDYDFDNILDEIGLDLIPVTDIIFIGDNATIYVTEIINYNVNTKTFEFEVAINQVSAYKQKIIDFNNHIESTIEDCVEALNKNADYNDFIDYCINRPITINLNGKTITIENNADTLNALQGFFDNLIEITG